VRGATQVQLDHRDAALVARDARLGLVETVRARRTTALIPAGRLRKAARGKCMPAICVASE